ncbi:MAG: single-stranded-DNA-specific exonuclease RecJ [Lachnospiraceae bacterium]|nr:single-stranded-DNA-specific exonuclease RecJ [Lachnospiraceae bacterium]
MKKWFVYTKKADFNAIAEKYNITPVMARIMRNRDVESDEAINRYLNGGLKALYSASLMKDVDKAVAIITEKISQGKKVRVIGDYDIDGIMAIYVLIKGLRRCGAFVDGRIPHRVKDGYGINESLIKDAHEDGVDTIITCDNGIAAAEQIEYAKSLGMTVIITDHHDIPYRDDEDGRHYIIPKAAAVIDPKQEDCGYPFKLLCGAAVAWKLLCALYEKTGVPITELEEFLEMVAIATVGDIVLLQDENRILVKEGLKRIPNTKNLGLKALIAANNLNPLAISSYHIGFVIGPCLNASGRLETAYMALELLMSESKAEAESRAGELKALNDSRKELTKEAELSALNMIESTELIDDKVLVVYLPECHESLAGIVAGRVREAYSKPTIVLTNGEEGLKGSGRSIEAYNMFEELVKVRDLLDKFGGHPMAAGMSLKKEKLTEFRQRLNKQTNLTEADFVEKVWIDVAMPFGYINDSFISELKKLEPFGNGNEKPVFAAKVTVSSYRIIGTNRNVLRMSLKDEYGTPLDAISFGDVQRFEERIKTGAPVIPILYYPEINEYNGIRSIQIVVTDYT